MKQIPFFIGWLLVLAAFGLYAYGIEQAIYQSLSKLPPGQKPSIPEPLDVMVSSIGAILLTNLGAVLGISVTNPDSGLARKFLLIKAGAAPIPPPLNSREKIQYAGVIIFILALISCFIVWAKKGFSSDAAEIVSVIPQLGKTLIGVVSAYLAFILGVNKA